MSIRALLVMVYSPCLAVTRYIACHPGLPDDWREEYVAKQTGGHRALKVMEQHLAQQQYFVGEHLTIADISLYAYTHVSEEGGFELTEYPSIRAWLDRIATEPGYIQMTD